MLNNQTFSILLKRSNDMLTKHLADFSDADLMVRPVEGANHAAWQLLHVLKSSTAMANAIAPDAPLTFPAKYADIATKTGAASDDPAQFPSKQELLEYFQTLQSTLSAAVETMTPDQLSAATPEKFQSFAATTAEMLMMIPLHTTMHIGQIQVIRRKLQKPRLF